MKIGDAAKSVISDCEQFRLKRIQRSFEMSNSSNNDLRLTKPGMFGGEPVGAMDSMGIMTMPGMWEGKVYDSAEYEAHRLRTYAELYPVMKRHAKEALLFCPTFGMKSQTCGIVGCEGHSPKSPNHRHMRCFLNMPVPIKREWTPSPLRFGTRAGSKVTQNACVF